MDYNVTSAPDIKIGETNPEVQNSLSSCTFLQCVDDVLVRVHTFFIFLHLLHSDFHVVEWACKGTGNETRAGWGYYSGFKGHGIHFKFGLQHLLELIKGRQLPHRKGRRSSYIGCDSIPHFCDSFLFAHSNSSVEKARVVSSLVFGQKPIVLEADHHEVGWMWSKTSNWAAHKCNRSLQIQRRILTP